MNQPGLCSRRCVLASGLGLGIGAVVGCQPKPELVATSEAPTERNDVPLRLAIVSDSGDTDAEAIRRAWSAVTQQPLDIQTIVFERGELGDLSDQVQVAAKKSDLVVYPLTLVTDLVVAKAIVPLSEAEFGELGKKMGPLLPSVRNGAAQYGGEYYALPLGAVQPAFLSREIDVEEDTEGQPMSWQDYDELVKAWKGAAGEPSAPGWAGAMFLWRASEIQSWLFSRETLVPTIATEPYVGTLELMVKTNKRYQDGAKTPGQVWEEVAAGKLKGGIGFPVRPGDFDSEVQVQDLPGAGNLSRVLLDAFSSMISLSSNCRQSAAAKRFAGWIGGGAAAEAVRSEVAGMTVVRSARGSLGARAREVSSYDQWLSKRLQAPVTVPTLQVIQSCRYYAALDQQIIRALKGQDSPKQALDALAETWRMMNEEIGVEKQRRAWQRAQGIS